MAQELEKPLPHDNLMERAVLGAVLAGHEQVYELLATIRPEDFFDNRHRRIAKVVLDLNETGRRPELIAVYDVLASSDGIETVGGIAYLSGLVDGIPLRGDTLYIVRGLRRMATFRQAIYAAENIKRFAFDQVGSAESLLDSAVETFSVLARELESTEDDGKAYFDAAIEAISMARQGARLKIFTNIDKLDQWTGGFREGELIVLTAETGTGKSLLAAQIRARACRDGHHALFCSGEMSSAHLASRELASVSGVVPIKMRRDDLFTAEDLEALAVAASHQCKKCRILDGELSLPRIRRVARKMKAGTGLDLLILDYDELIEAEGKTEFEQQRVIARTAKSLAIELRCAVVLISQLRKASSKEDAGKPTLQRLYGNAAKQKFASFIILADRPYVRKLEGDEKQAELQLLKSRDGKTGRIKATFNVKSLRFEEATKDVAKAQVLRDDTAPHKEEK